MTHASLRLICGCCWMLLACGGGAARRGSPPPPGGCVDLSHFAPWVGQPNTWDLRVVGSGFQADEGNTVRVVVTVGEPSYGLGEAAIRGGSFDISLPGTAEPYTGIGVYIDRDRNDACNVDSDSLWQMTTGGVPGDYLWQVTPSTRDPVGAQPCNINGIFDLTVPLGCD